MFEAFRETDYRRFWTSQFLSNVGSWMQTVAQGYLVYSLTDSAFLLGFVGFVNAVPSVFLMLWGGVLADRHDRLRIVRASQWVQALAALLIAISIRTGNIAVWQIAAAAALSGVAISFSAPAWQAMVLDLLEERSRLANAVAMNSLQFQLSRVIGPLLAGATLAAFGSFWCFLINALSFLPLIFVLARIRSRQQPAGGNEPVWDRLRAGFAYVRSQRMVLLALLIAAAASALGIPYLNLMPVVARKLFPAAEAEGLGYLLGVAGAGALLGSLALSVKTPPRRVMLPAVVVALAVFGLSLAVIGMIRRPAAVMVLLFFCGVSMVVCLALCNTSIQQRVPDAMRGRVLSMYTFSFYAFNPFGNLFAGAVAEHRGIGLTLALLGGALFLCAVAAGIAVGRRRRGATMLGEVRVPGRDVEWR